ncbi:MAG: NIPSNAP family protein [Chloroflexi bacterium]|nr:NIPSNAP family protein [Chloroflexota bacterium]
MIYEMRTYTLKPGALADFEARFGEGLPYRERYSRLGAFWHTEIGPLNQVIHVWPYESLEQRTALRAAAAKDPHWPPRVHDLVVAQESEILLPAPFMRPLEPRQMGPLYEMRTYTYQPGAIPEVLKLWGEAIPYREQHSPLAACWYTELGVLNKFIHVWPYKDFAERVRIREEATKGGHWPAPTRQWIVRQENKLLFPAPFSPLR